MTGTRIAICALATVALTLDALAAFDCAAESGEPIVGVLMVIVHASILLTVWMLAS